MNPKTLALISIGVIIILTIVIALIVYLRKDNFLNKVEDLLSEENYTKALRELLKRVDANPHDFTIKYYLGQTYEGLKEFDKAIHYYQKAAIGATDISQLPVKLKLFYKLAEIYRKQGKLKEALGYYILVIDKNPNHAHALFHIAEIYSELHNHPKATEALQKLLQINPSHIRAHFLLAEIFRKEKNYTRASAHLEYILTNDQSGDRLFLNRIRMELGLIYLEMKNYTKCENILEPLVTDASYGNEALLTILKALIESRQTEKALALIEIKQKDYPKSKLHELIYAKGRALYADHLYYEALMAWKEAYSLKPDYEDLKSIRSKYQVIMDHPKLEAVFSSNENLTEEFINRLSNSRGVGHIVKTKHYWIFRIGEFVYSLYRIPFPVPAKELVEMQDKITGVLQVTSAFTLLSLFGIDHMKEDLFNYKKLTIVSEIRFVDMVEKGSLDD